jgi:hypothetical protein
MSVTWVDTNKVTNAEAKEVGKRMAAAIESALSNPVPEPLIRLVNGTHIKLSEVKRLIPKASDATLPPHLNMDFEDGRGTTVRLAEGENVFAYADELASRVNAARGCGWPKNPADNPSAVDHIDSNYVNRTDEE